jgi:hypothetical protein
MEATKQTETAAPTPEQLLRLLDIQLEMERSKRAKKSRNRATFLAGGIAVIVVAAAVALVVGQQVLEDLRDRGALNPMAGDVQEGR